MKNINYIILYIFILSSILGCNDLLEVEPKGSLSGEVLWSDTKSADMFLNNIYAGLPSPFNTDDPLENWTDNTMMGRAFAGQSQRHALSEYTPSNARDRWGEYGNIRKANVFIKNVENSNLSNDWKKQKLGEARFLRAYYYMRLWTAYGGVPIITDVLNLDEQGDEIFRARNTAEETYHFIINECEAIANDLPLTAEGGRATRGAALALKAYSQLFWASPLYNSDNDLSRWEDAVDTYKQIMDLDVYDLFPDYNTMFFEENNNNIEVIFAKQHLGGTSLGGSREGLQGPSSIGGQDLSYGGVAPTQELVDSYFMANGLSIDHPQSGYDPQNPYENREDRFYQSIVYDGAMWLGHEYIAKQGVGSENKTNLDGTGGTRTGYAPRKGMNPEYAIHGPNQLNGANFIIFRYGGVLLSYAEAQNEAVGPDQSVYDAINKIRERSNLPPLEEGLSQEDMRKAIYQERRVELAMEEKRWNDLIRLRLAEEKLNGALHAMVIRQEGGEWVYRVQPALEGEVAFYPEKNYFLPIPQSAINQNPELTQNPGY